MQCPQCGAWNDEGTTECRECGINLAWASENIREACPACGSLNPRGSARCATCGLDLSRSRQKQQEVGINQQAGSDQRHAQQMQMAQRAANIAAGGSAATASLIWAIVGFFVCPIILGLIGISRDITSRREAEDWA